MEKKKVGGLRRSRRLKRAPKGFSPLEKLISFIFLAIFVGAVVDYLIREVVVPAILVALGLGPLWAVYLVLRSRRARQADAMEAEPPERWEVERPWEGAAPEEKKE